MNERRFHPPEVTWSIMHPTKPTVGYMREVIAAADGYHVHSFEICGDAHSSSGNLDGAIFFRDYPAAAARIDRSAVHATIANLNAMVELAHRSGRPVYYWHREVMVPREVVERVPGLLDENGEFDLLGTAYHTLIRSKIREFFANVPGMDGLVLTVTESDYSVIHNSNPDRYPPTRVIERVIHTFVEELQARGKRFVLRSFGSVSQDYEDILAGAALVSPELKFEIETKITPYDFSPFLDFNPFLRRSGAAELSAEHDSIGEFLGAGYLPAPDPDRVLQSLRHAARAGVSRHAIRVDRIGHPTFTSTQAINLFAYDRAISDPSVTAQQIWREWAKKHWPECPEEMTDVMRQGIEMVKKIQFIDGHLIFHAFPLDASQKWVKAGGILSLFQPGIRLADHQGMWGILTTKETPTRDWILQEKDEAVIMADAGFARVSALRPRLPPEEFARSEAAWRNATVVSRLIREWCRCLCAYRDDMDAGRIDHRSLTAAIRAAKAIFEEQLGILLPLDLPPAASVKPLGQGHEYAHDNTHENSIEAAYGRPLWKILLTLESEFVAEAQERRRCLEQQGVIDFVVCGGIAHDHRVQRYMHASHATLTAGRVSRIVGNRVFPNGFIECRFSISDLADVQVVICGDREKTPGFLLLVDGRPHEAAYDAEGKFALAPEPISPSGVLVVRIQKLGPGYPWIHSISIVAV